MKSNPAKPAPSPCTQRGLVIARIEASDEIQTNQIQQAIEQAACKGGGVVCMQAGTHRSGTVWLRTGVELHLEPGACLIADRDPGEYAILDSVPAHPGRVQALVACDGEEDVAITGSGTIAAWGIEPVSWHDANRMAFRPSLIYMRRCRRVRVQGVTLRDSVFWTCHFRDCQNVDIRSVTIRNRWPNSDGINPDGCSNVTIQECDIESGDDCICLKSTHGDRCERVRVSDCRLITSCAALKLGTEALGDIRDVRFQRCRIRTTGQALAIYAKDCGNYTDVSFSDIQIDAPQSQFPVVVDITPRDYRQTDQLGGISTVSFENITLRSPGRIYIEGHPQRPIQHLSLNGLRFDRSGPLNTHDVQKPMGSARGVLDPDRNRYCSLCGSLVLVHVRHAYVAQLVITHGSEHADTPLIAHLNADVQMNIPRTRGVPHANVATPPWQP